MQALYSCHVTFHLPFQSLHSRSFQVRRMLLQLLLQLRHWTIPRKLKSLSRWNLQPISRSKNGRRSCPCPAGPTSHGGSEKCFSCERKQSAAPGSPLCAWWGKGCLLTAPCMRVTKRSQPCTTCPKGSYASSLNTLHCTKCLAYQQDVAGQRARVLQAVWKAWR